MGGAVSCFCVCFCLVFGVIVHEHWSGWDSKHTCHSPVCVCEMFGDVINSVICVCEMFGDVRNSVIVLFVCVRCLGMSETVS